MGVTTTAPDIMKYYDYVTKPYVTAAIHWRTAHGQLFVSFPGSNKQYHKVRAKALVQGSKCWQPKTNFKAAHGNQAEIARVASIFESRNLEDFEILIIRSVPQSKDADRYPETNILGRFKGVIRTCSFTRSSLTQLFGAEDVKKGFAKQRNADGSPIPKKAILKDWIQEDDA